VGFAVVNKRREQSRGSLPISEPGSRRNIALAGSADAGDVVVVLVLGERGDVYGPTLAAGAASRYVSRSSRRRCCPTPQGPRQQSCHGPCSRPVPRSRRGWCSPTRTRSAPRRPRPAGRRAVTSFRHAPCLAAPGVPLRYRLPACAAPVTGRASSSLRSGTSRARCSVVGDVKRPRHGNALPILAAVTQAAKRCRWCERGCRGRQLVRQRLRLFARATVVRDADADPTRYEDPALLTELA
jgi:hypothetical protein